VTYYNRKKVQVRVKVKEGRRNVRHSVLTGKGKNNRKMAKSLTSSLALTLSAAHALRPNPTSIPHSGAAFLLTEALEWVFPEIFNWNSPILIPIHILFKTCQRECPPQRLYLRPNRHW